MWLPLTYVTTGAINVLLIKWMDILFGECSDGFMRPFQHPVLQALLMFFAEFLCFVVYKIVYFFLQRRGDGSHEYNALTRGGREFSPMMLLMPACLDSISSIMLFAGLFLTYASSFQMIRGAALIFVGIFSSIHLNQTLIVRHWTAMFTIVCGIIVVIAVDIQRTVYDTTALPNADGNSILTGSLLIICAEIFHAARCVYEEKYIKTADVPALLAVGWQGIFGLALTSVLAVCMNFLPTSLPFDKNTRGVFDDFGDIMSQLNSQPIIWLAISLFVVSCAVYNAVSLSIVKYSSSTNRILADGLRVLFIWWTALILEWEYLNFLTLLGFIIIEMGAVAYRNAIFIEWYRSLLLRLQRRRYDDLIVEPGSDAGGPSTTASHPADVI